MAQEEKANWEELEQLKLEGLFEFREGRTFDERVKIAKLTSIDSNMTYEQRLRMQRLRYGL